MLISKINTEYLNRDAGDAVVFAKSPEAKIQSILNDLELYCAAWGLKVNIYKKKINILKTKVMIFEKGRHTNYDFYLNNVKLELVTSFKVKKYKMTSRATSALDTSVCWKASYT